MKPHDSDRDTSAIRLFMGFVFLMLTFSLYLSGKLERILTKQFEKHYEGKETMQTFIE